MTEEYSRFTREIITNFIKELQCSVYNEEFENTDSNNNFNNENIQMYRTIIDRRLNSENLKNDNVSSSLIDLLKTIYKSCHSVKDFDIPRNVTVINELVKCFAQLVKKFNTAERNLNEKSSIQLLYNELGIVRNLEVKYLDLTLSKELLFVELNFLNIFLTLDIYMELSEVDILMLISEDFVSKMILLSCYKSVSALFYNTFLDYLTKNQFNVLLIKHFSAMLIKHCNASDICLSLVICSFDKLSPFFENMSRATCEGNDVHKALASDMCKDDVFSPTCIDQPLALFNCIKKIALSNLNNKDSLLRKQALYILKRIFPFESLINKSCINHWETFFCTFETLDESQVHLILPVIENINALVGCDNILLKLLIEKMLCHESSTIIRHGLEKLVLLKENSKLIKELLPTILKASNDANLFLPESKNIEHSLVSLFKNVNSPLLHLDNFVCLMENIITVPWGPIPLFFIFYYLKLSTSNMSHDVVPRDQVENNLNVSLNLLTKLVLIDFKHNITIRSAVQCFVMDLLRDVILIPLEKLNLKNSIVIMDKLTQLVDIMKDKFQNLPVQKLYQSIIVYKPFDREFIVPYLEAHLLDEKSNINSFCINYMIISLSSDAFDFTHILDLVKRNSSKIFGSPENVIKLASLSNQCKQIYGNDGGLLSLFSKFYSLQNYTQHLPQLLVKITVDITAAEYIIGHCNLSLVDIAPDKYCHDFCFHYKLYDIFMVSDETLKNSNFNPWTNRFNFTLGSYLLLKQDGSLANSWLKRYHNHAEIMFDKKYVFENYEKHGCFDILQLKLNILKLVFSNCAFIEELPLKLVSLLVDTELCIEFLCNSNRDCLETLLEVMGMIINEDQLHTDSRIIIIKHFVKKSWTEVLNLKKTTKFRVNCAQWITSVFQSNFVHHHSSFLEKIVFQIYEHDESSRYFFEQISTILKPLVDHYKSQDSPHLRLDIFKNPEFYRDILVTGLTYGVLPKRDILQERLVCDFIKHNQADYFLRDTCHEKYVRYSVISTLRYFRHSSTLCTFIQEWIIPRLMAVFDQDTNQYFNNSLSHRIKHRVLQGILVISDAQHSKLMPWALGHLLQYNHQPSVRYFLEWIIIRHLKCCTVITHDIAKNTYELFWVMFDRAFHERPGSVVAFLSIVYHVVRQFLDEVDDEIKNSADVTIKNFIDASFEFLIPCSMSQLFNVRLYAHVIFKKLYKQSKHLTDIQKKYELHYKGMLITANSAKGNAILNCEKLERDFYFNLFDPEKNYSFETIFYDLPRLANVAADELISLVDIPSAEITCYMPIKNPYKFSLTEVKKSDWIVTSTTKEVPDESSTSGTLVSQKKFIPWKSMNIESSLILSTTSSTDLVIVTSLIDKLPNIGGLSRTCEIFGATLVVNNLEILKDAQFKALSMTSEKHLNIIEVKRHNLKEYLMKKKTEDHYQLIAAEQTTTSQQLHNFQFPKKSILVLGNEKDGVDCDILLLLDSYVEVPQLGVLRSLNVHVTGAIFVWEYVKQHCL